MSTVQKIEALALRVLRRFRGNNLRFTYTPEKTTTYLIGDILAAARDCGNEALVARYLVGAKLQLRFPKIENFDQFCRSNGGDFGRKADFTIQDTAFHITVTPTTETYEKCLVSANEGKPTVLLVPTRTVEGARQYIENTGNQGVDVAAIESFVGFNFNEISMFGKGASAKALRKLLEIYNARVKAVETDLSLMIDIPKNLGF